MGDFIAASTGAADIRKLASLISRSCDAIIAAHDSVGYDVPSLYSTVPGPFDTPDKAPLELGRHIQIVEAACAQLCASIASPTHVVINVRACMAVKQRNALTH